MEDLAVGADNQLHKACIMFSTCTTLHKQTATCTLFRPLQRFHSDQAKDLKSPKDTIPWELRMIESGLDDCIRSILVRLADRPLYPKLGVTVSWDACIVTLDDADLKLDDGICDMCNLIACNNTIA